MFCWTEHVETVVNLLKRSYKLAVLTQKIIAYGMRYVKYKFTAVILSDNGFSAPFRHLFPSRYYTHPQ